MINCLRNVSMVHPCSKRENLNDFIVRSYLINQSSRRPGCRPDLAAIHHPKVACQSVQNTRNPTEKDFKNYAIPFQTVQILNPAWILQRHESDEALSPFGLNSDEVCLTSQNFFRWKGLWVKWSCWSIVGQFSTCDKYLYLCASSKCHSFIFHT